jgi:hypothetical protein
VASTSILSMLLSPSVSRHELESLRAPGRGAGTE